MAPFVYWKYFEQKSEWHRFWLPTNETSSPKIYTGSKKLKSKNQLKVFLRKCGQNYEHAQVIKCRLSNISNVSSNVIWNHKN
jgi:hypothetical protein